MTDCAKLLMLAMTTSPASESTTAWSSSIGARTAAIKPLSSSETLVISRPRALTASSASRKPRAPQATRAPYSPRLWPITISGVTPYAASNRVSARSAARTAGWVIAVCRSASSAPATAASSRGSTKMISLSGLPRRGFITSSASRKVSATIGSTSRSSRSMLTYCEPCPVYRNAVFGAGPVW